MRSVSSILSLVSLLLFAKVAHTSIDNLNRDCGFFALNGAGFNNAGLFTLAAFEEGAANDSATPLPLEINPRSRSLSLIEGETVTPTLFALSDGTLYANDTDGIVEVAKPAINGTVVLFFKTFGEVSISQFCAVANTDPAGGPPDPTLALLGDPDSFSICKTNSTPPTSAVVYNATANSKSYNINDCTKVQVHLLPPQ